MKVAPSAGSIKANAAAWSCHMISKAGFDSVNLLAATVTAICVVIKSADNDDKVAQAAIANRDQSDPLPPRRCMSPCSAVTNNRSSTIFMVSSPEVIAKAP